MEASSGEVTRDQASHVYGLCYKYLTEKMMHVVRAWYEDMTERCAAAAERLTASNTPDAPSHHTLLLTLLRTCAFDVGIDELAKQKMLERFDAFVYADFIDCKQVYQQLFVSKSRLLASPIIVASSDQRAKFRVPSCDAFMRRVLVETAKVAIGSVDYYTSPDGYEKQSHKISIRYSRVIKGLLNSSMPSWSQPEVAPPPAAEAAMPEMPASLQPPMDTTPTPTGAMAIDVPPLTVEQAQILASESLLPPPSAEAASAAPTRRLQLESDFNWQ